MKAFTLIEILVVVAIIGILSSFIFFTVQEQIDRANITKYIIFGDNIRMELLDSLVSEWGLDGGTPGSTVQTSNVLDAWGSNHAFSIVGDPTIRGGSDCIIGNCIEFDGNDNITISNDINLQFTNEFTIEAWVYATGFPWSGYGFIVQKGNAGYSSDGGYSPAYVSTGSTFYTFVRKSDNSAYSYNTWSSPIKDRWYHFVFTFNNGIGRVYADGEQKGEDKDYGFTSAHQNNGTFRIGDYFIGKLDEIRVYSQALTDAEVRFQYYSFLSRLSQN